MNEDDGAARRARNWKRAGLATTILLAPGGFVLGGALAWRYYRARKGAAAPAERADD